MGNALATHKEPSSKLITAHEAHHYDGHVAVRDTEEWGFLDVPEATS